jgi:Domain of unknown function (DUF4258)
MKHLLFFALFSFAPFFSSCDKTVKKEVNTMEMPVEYDRQTSSPASNRAENPNTGPDAVLRYQGKDVKVTKHGKCRMECRQLDLSEIQEVLDKGEINAKKSGQNDKPGQCPTTALEGKTRDGQRARVIVSDCGTHCNLVTVIDLDTEFKCHCK